jgi:hypothetical protein
MPKPSQLDSLELNWQWFAFNASMAMLALPLYLAELNDENRNEKREKEGAEKTKEKHNQVNHKLVSLRNNKQTREGMVLMDDISCCQAVELENNWTDH